jgi:hypothetical protein
MIEALVADLVDFTGASTLGRLANGLSGSECGIMSLSPTTLRLVVQSVSLVRKVCVGKFFFFFWTREALWAKSGVFGLDRPRPAKADDLQLQYLGSICRLLDPE